MIEIETKIIDFDSDSLRKKLKERGAKYLGRFLQRRWVYDVPHNHGEAFIRVRTDGTTSTIAYKHRVGGGMSNTEEIEVKVDDFDRAVDIFSRLIKNKYYQENWREAYLLEGLEITINEWPKIPPVLEIEGKSEKLIKKLIKDLDIGGKDLGSIGWPEVYRLYKIDLHSFDVLKL
jgi:adenylate cyclase class 2